MLEPSSRHSTVKEHFSYRSLPMVGGLSLIVSLVLFCAGGYIDSLLFEHSIVEKFPPNFESPYVFKTALVISGAFLLVSGVVIVGYIPEMGLLWSDINSLALITPSWQGFQTDKSYDFRITEVLIYGVILLSFSFLALFFYHPWSFSSLGREDSFLEWCSVFFYVINCSIFLYLFVYYHTKRQKAGIFYWTTLAFATIFFLIAMEEISWFQRLLDFDTPKAFQTNQQSEFNFHNFQTKPIEQVYYFGSFFFLIVLPFINEHVSLKPYIRELVFFIPSRLILFFSAIFVSYNWQMWNVLFTQVSFFVTLFIILYYCLFSKYDKKNFYCLVCLIGTLCLTQLIWITGTNSFERTILLNTKNFSSLFPTAFIRLKYYSNLSIALTPSYT